MTIKHWFFHEWVYAGQFPVSEPTRGPFDPRTEAEREIQKFKFVCAECGKVQFFNPPSVPTCY